MGEDTMTTRRKLLIAGGVVGAGIITEKLSAVSALAASQKPLRRSLGDLTIDDPILQAWRDAVDKLKHKQASDPISWTKLATIHGTSAGFHLCPHGNWYFLPWHRAFLVMYETIVRDITGHQDFALPYWDWTANRQLPGAFAQPNFKGAPNPLFETQRDATPTDSLGDEIVGSTVINRILNKPNFEDFGTTRPTGQNSRDPSWIKKRGVKGELESNPHDNVHGFVGGLMGGSQSALDPIFMMHHCNLDRIWAVWNAPPFNNHNSSDPLWTGMTFKDHFLHTDGSTYSATVSDLYSPEALGYTYGLSPGAAPTEQEPALVTLSQNFEAFVAAPNMPTTSNVKSFTAANVSNAKATMLLPLAISVPVDRNLVSEVAKTEAVSAGEIFLNFNTARARAAAGRRALAFVRDIDFSAQQNTMYRVFLDCDYLSKSTPISDPHYVGTFGHFGDHAGDNHAKPSVALDLTSAIKRVYGNATDFPDHLNVQIISVPIRGTNDHIGSAAPAKIEVVFM
jgi:tyrosinase